ncbi:MAG: YifB family Mg chelatase-like AAA ATPase [Campylobacteraceae bacterium]|jgi:magnesium chelatase family protein|nr:YifB family Mg chelatase-like AAA ATPase [Campylobacteraceae bacterium]
MKRLLCATLEANIAHSVEVESTFVRALPSFSIVGLAQQSIQESRDRIKAALGSINFNFPAQKITINLSPSDLPKSGSHFDLGVALLIALQKSNVNFKDFYCFGELGLGGSVKSTVSIFPIILSLASKLKSLKVVVPCESLDIIASIPNVRAYGVDTLQEAVEFFTNTDSQDDKEAKITHELFQNSIQIAGKTYIFNNDFALDFADIKGQSHAKEAMMIAAAGMHNVLLEGSPGCGKSMSVKRLLYIMPPLEVNEILQNAANRSLGGENTVFSKMRPFRAPHHTSSRPSIFGGGSNFGAKIGEVALAHNGILFFDEFPHFSKDVLESLREPLEDGHVLISRVNSKICYDTKFIFAAAQNPCPCGNLFSSIKPCKCSDIDIQRYKAKISAPLLDRIDIYVQMDESGVDDKSDISSKQMQANVLKAFTVQKMRGQEELNGKMDDGSIERFCILDDEAKEILKNAAIRFGLSHRGVGKIKKVARTIADLESADLIEKSHILKSLKFRHR